jgi:hypothetical protein
MRRVTIYFIKIFFFIFIIISYSVYGQNTFQGIILDSITKKPVPYAIVRSFSFGSYCDSAGTFLFKNILDDSAYISCVGYLDKSVKINKEKKDTIYLLPFYKSLVPVIIGDYEWQKNKKIQLGRLDGKSKFRVNVPPTGLTVLKYFPNPEPLKNYIISELILRVDESASINYSTKFRVRVFQAKDNVTVGEDILNAPDVFKLTTIKENLAHVDLRKFELNIPPTGCFIGVEFIGTNEEPNIGNTLSLKGWLAPTFEDGLVMTRYFSATFRPFLFGGKQKANLYFSITLFEIK